MSVFMKKSSTECTDDKAPWTGRKKFLVLAGAPVLALATTAGAMALYFALAGINGGGSTGTFSAEFMGTTPVMDTSALTVKPSTQATVVGSELQLPTDLRLFPGESFSVTADLKTTSKSGDGYVSGINMAGMPAGYSAELLNGCGAQARNGIPVQIKITAGPSQADGVSWTLSESAGVMVTPGAPTPAGLVCAPYIAQ